MSTPVRYSTFICPDQLADQLIQFTDHGYRPATHTDIQKLE
ncbi:hypothetical protein [Motiliproteus sp. MSK22-1]|nr:hypothetical protein [Motiliproteus sp. MSK22-1]